MIYTKKIKIYKTILFFDIIFVVTYMAGTITHAYFALDVYKKLNKNTKKILKDYKENLKTYAQGPDILFFSTNIFNHKKVKKIGNYIHKHDTKKLFINMITYIKNNNLENNGEIISFLYGYIMHYALDTKVHPYIIYKTGIFNKKKKETYKYNSKHSDMESYIDAFMINKNEKINPNKFKIHKFCFNYNKISKNLSKLIDYSFNKTYEFKNLSFYFKQGLFNMKYLYRILRYDPFNIKINIYKILDRFHTKKSKDFYPISYSYKLNNNSYYLNLEHNKWCHPRYNDEIYYDSFLDLYNEAIIDALNIINNVNEFLFYSNDISILNKIFLNLSFSSGKECNNKAKNRYFEF